MGITLLTGYTGIRHITPEMDAAVQRGMFGAESYILESGNQLEASMPSVTEFQILDGVLSMQGHTATVTQETLTIDTCAASRKRIDLVCARYTHDASSLIDAVELIVIKGTEVDSTNTPTVPDYNEGVIADGAAVVDVPIYQINFVGATVTFESKLTVLPNLDECYLSPSTVTLWKSILGIS